MASKSNKSRKFSGIYGAMNRTENKLAEKFFSKKAGNEKTSNKTLKNKVEDKKQTQHTRQKH